VDKTISMNQRKCVIFDVDGVLVDSYTAHLHSWLALAARGDCPPLTEDQFRATFGRTTRETITAIWPDASLSGADIADLDARKEAVFRDMLRADFRPIAGAVSLIAALGDAGFGLAAGSSGPPENVFLILDQLGCRELFEVVVTGDDVVRGKPDPEVFLACARGLHAPPARCAVIEDAVAGVEAANRAGMFSIALVADGRDVNLFHHANHIVRHLSELTPSQIHQSLP
jgi:beta-phosphoglucomutase